MSASASVPKQNNDISFVTLDLTQSEVQLGSSSYNSIALDSQQLHNLSSNMLLRLQDKQAKQTEGDSSEYAPLVSQRFINFSQHDPLRNRPSFLLAFEFLSPPIPSLTVGYRIDVSPAVDWLLHIESASHRLSAWKESNLLYRFSHSHSLS
nr:hypothetical protein [Shewanella gelidimarina]